MPLTASKIYSFQTDFFNLCKFILSTALHGRNNRDPKREQMLFWKNQDVVNWKNNLGGDFQGLCWKRLRALHHTPSLAVPEERRLCEARCLTCRARSMPPTAAGPSLSSAKGQCSAHTATRPVLGTGTSGALSGQFLLSGYQCTWSDVGSGGFL